MKVEQKVQTASRPISQSWQRNESRFKLLDNLPELFNCRPATELCAKELTLLFMCHVLLCLHSMSGNYYFYAFASPL